MNLRRDHLKGQLLNEQMAVVRNVGFRPVCPRCWEREIYSIPTDLHEGLVKKGDVQGWDEADRELINATENCVVLCHVCHMEEGQTTEMTEWFIMYKTSLGYDLVSWIKSLPFKQLPSLRQAALNKVLS